MYSVLVSHTFQKQFHSLQKPLQKMIRNALNELEINPDQPRSGADIKPNIIVNGPILPEPVQIDGYYVDQ